MKRSLSFSLKAILPVRVTDDHYTMESEDTLGPTYHLHLDEHGWWCTCGYEHGMHQPRRSCKHLTALHKLLGVKTVTVSERKGITLESLYPLV